MEKLILTTENALLLNGRTLEDGNIRYEINTSTIRMNGDRVLTQMTVDGYIDDEWVHEISCSYEEGELIESDSEEWLKLI